jgi:hypothetical protein
MTLKKLLNKHSTHLDFWAGLENAGADNRLMFEEYVALYLKATLPGETYWLGEDVVPPHIAQKYRFENLLKGKRSLGSDIINIYQNRAVGYESKWLDKKETINLKLVANKLVVIQNTNIDSLIFTTNARKPSNMVTEFTAAVGFMFQEDWIRKDVFETVKSYVNNQVKKVYKPMTPRDSFFQDSLDELKTEFDKKFAKKSIAKIITRIFQHWPAASGKGSFPRLAYDYIFEPRWDYKKGCPINVVVNPTLTVLKGNLVKHIHHDLALGNNTIHVIYSGDVTKAAKDTEELQAIRSMAKVFTNKIEFVKFLRTTPAQTVWIHTTVHSYDKLASVVKGQKKSFYFGHIDEVHHMIQPDYSSWTAPLDDKSCVIQIRLMSSANKRKAKGTGATYSMDDPSFCDILVKELDEKTAVKLGYKRQSKMANYLYNSSSFPTDWLEMLEGGSQPLVKLKGTKFVVPMGWFIAADAILRFRIEYPDRNHTKFTLNSIENCQNFAEFFKAICPRILKQLASSNNPVYRRLLKAKVMVADTLNNSTVKLLKEVSAIPDTYTDSFIIHCRLLGEGWDPENGWIDNSMFVDPSGSEIRIYQDVNRGSRIGNGSKKINWVIQSHLVDNEKLQFNKMYDTIKTVCQALEIGDDDITETVIFKEFKSIPKGKTTNRQVGSSALSYYDEIDADFFAQGFSTFIKEGRHYKFGETVNSILKDYIRLDQEKRGYLSIQNNVYADVIKLHPDYFSTYSKNQQWTHLNRIIKGEHFLLSDDNIASAISWQIDREELKIADKQLMKQELEKGLRKYAFVDNNAVGEVARELALKYNYNHRRIVELKPPAIVRRTYEEYNQDTIVALYKSSYKKFNNVNELDNYVIQHSNVKLNRNQCVEKIRKPNLPFLTKYFDEVKHNKRSQAMKDNKIAARS